MNLQHFPTPQIKHKDERSYFASKKLLIGTFSVLEDVIPSESKFNTPSLTVGIVEQVKYLLLTTDMEWVIRESYGGLYLDVNKFVDPMRFEHSFRVAMFVFVDPKIYTFCQLKYSENLTRMVE